jgi:hypothetical protein
MTSTFDNRFNGEACRSCYWFHVNCCDCTKSGHYGHLVSGKHPACAEYKKDVSVAKDRYVKDS